MADLLSIGAVADASGVRHSALRYYEEKGLIAPAARRNGRRVYEPSVLRRLAFIAHCQTVGFTIEEIAVLLGGSRRRARWRSVAERKLSELDAHIERARRARAILAEALACGCGDPASCELVTGRHLLQIGRPERPNR